MKSGNRAVRAAALAALALLLTPGWSGVPAGPGLALAQAGSETRACVREINDSAMRAHGWSFIVRRIEISGEDLVVWMSVRNDEAATGLIGLDPGAEHSASLIHLASERVYPAGTITGVEPALQHVESHLRASFHFPVPAKGGRLRLVSAWVTAVMGGAGQRIVVEYPFTLPDGEPCGS